MTKTKTARNTRRWTISMLNSAWSIKRTTVFAVSVSVSLWIMMRFTIMQFCACFKRFRIAFICYKLLFVILGPLHTHNFVVVFSLADSPPLAFLSLILSLSVSHTHQSEMIECFWAITPSRYRKIRRKKNTINIFACIEKRMRMRIAQSWESIEKMRILKLQCTFK